jgi:hypothetical protein
MLKLGRTTLLVLACTVFLGLACAPARAAALPPQHDLPVGPEEPRDVVRVELDLPKTATCEEAFDLALYTERGVDRVDWNDSAHQCSARLVTIRYLPKRIDRRRLLERVKKLALSTRVVAQ